MPSPGRLRNKAGPSLSTAHVTKDPAKDQETGIDGLTTLRLLLSIFYFQNPFVDIMASDPDDSPFVKGTGQVHRPVPQAEKLGPRR